MFSIYGKSAEETDEHNNSNYYESKKGEQFYDDASFHSEYYAQINTHTSFTNGTESHE